MIIRKLKYAIYKTIEYCSPWLLANIIYERKLKRKINWKHPHDLNEKIQWLKFNSDTSDWTKLADKYKVREYVRKSGYGDILIELYGYWKNADDIDFNILPDSFVLKTNHDFGTVIIIKDKSKANLEEIRQILTKALARRFGRATAEPHYLNIEPVIIAEKYLGTQDQTSSLIDYKFHCFNGKPYNCLVCHDRVNKRPLLELYDIHTWTKMNHHITEAHVGRKEIPKPATLDTMLLIAKILSQRFPFVRVDLYEVDGKVYFGELTFTPCAGYIDYFTLAYLQELGEQVTLPNSV